MRGRVEAKLLKPLLFGGIQCVQIPLGRDSSPEVGAGIIFTLERVIC